MKMPSSAAIASCVMREAPETAREWEAVVIAILSFRPPPEGTESCVAGRSPGLRTCALPAFPKPGASVAFGDGYRLQLRGQPRLWAGCPHRIPSGPLGTVDEATIDQKAEFANHREERARKFRGGRLGHIDFGRWRQTISPQIAQKAPSVAKTAPSPKKASTTE